EGEHPPMKQGKMILAVAQVDEGMKFLLTHQKEEIRLLAEARLAISSWPLHIKRVQNLINQAKARNGFLGIPLSYHSAHTGRFGGSEGLNVHNFGKRGRTGSGIHPLIKEVGSLIEAPEGYTFITPDLSQIEARMLAWFAGQDDLLQTFANGEDVYSEFASDLFNSKVYKPDKDDPEPIQKLMEIRRGFGKDAILGCLSFNTPILTKSGWKKLWCVSTNDQLWDGVKWVRHKGIFLRGRKKCLPLVHSKNGCSTTSKQELACRISFVILLPRSTIFQKASMVQRKTTAGSSLSTFIHA
ncbi:hypothetical protein LCGC14_2759670, partial [marine sediment metagenome]